MGQLLRFTPKDGRAAPDDESMLCGLSGVAVVIEDLDAVAVEAGLNRTMLQALTERLLVEAGIRLFPLAAVEADPQCAVLYVRIGAERAGSGEIAWMLSLQVCEHAVLVRDSERRGGVVTWTTNGVFASSPADLVRDVVAAMDGGVERLREAFPAIENA